MLLSFMILSVFCYFYYNVPVHEACDDGSTDYVWEKNKKYYVATEGISLGKTNNEGHLSNFDYAIINSIDILISGSSHFQGFSVSQKDNIENVLSNLLADKTVYNISISGHNFKVCVSNLEDAISKYKPKLIVLETNKVLFSNDELLSMINNDIVDIASNNRGIIGFLQKNPFIRLAYEQISSFVNNGNNENQTNNILFNADLTDYLLKYIKKICGDTKVLILYHPTVDINKDGSLSVNSNKNDSSTFSDLCFENDIYFVDMTDRYLYEYEENNIVPSGFINTKIGSGHINKYGHKMIAEELYKVIKEIY